MKTSHTSLTSQGLSTELQRNRAATSKGNLAAMALYCGHCQIFSAPTKKKIFRIWDSADATLLSVKRKMKSAKWANYGNESLCNYWSNLFSLSQLDTVKILHNVSKELTQFVSKLLQNIILNRLHLMSKTMSKRKGNTDKRKASKLFYTFWRYLTVQRSSNQAHKEI